MTGSLHVGPTCGVRIAIRQQLYVELEFAPHTSDNDRGCLVELLAAQAGLVDVVITHWPPTKAAIHPKFEGDALNPYLINDRDDPGAPGRREALRSSG